MKSNPIFQGLVHSNFSPVLKFFSRLQLLISLSVRLPTQTGRPKFYILAGTSRERNRGMNGDKRRTMKKIQPIKKKKKVTHTFSFASYRSRQGLMIQFIKVYLFRKTIALCNSNNNTHEYEMFSIILCDQAYAAIFITLFKFLELTDIGNVIIGCQTSQFFSTYHTLNHFFSCPLLTFIFHVNGCKKTCYPY